MFCPSCRSEYRAGITTCVTCGVPLIEALAEVLPIGASEATLPVGISGERTLSRNVEIEGRSVDLARTFPYEQAAEMAAVLEDEGIPSRRLEVTGIEFPDHRPRFEVHVRTADHVKAETLLHGRWRELAENEGGMSETPDDPEQCPACGARIPLDVAECPDCGLNVGAAGEEAAE